MSSRGRTDGYVLLDALLAILLLSLAAAAVLPGLGITVRSSAGALERAYSLVEARNEAARIRMGPTSGP